MGLRHTIIKLFNRGLLQAFEAAAADPAGAQREALARLVGAHGQAGYLRRHGVAGADVARFRTSLPVVDYDGLRPFIAPIVEGGWPAVGELTVGERVEMFLKTSGTTGPAKLLPVTASYVAEADAGRRIWVERMLADDDRNGDGIHLAIISPMHESRSPGGIPVGSNTGRIFMSQPSLVRAFAPVPYPVFSLPEFDLRYYLILRFAAGRHDVGTLTTANPSTVLLLCRKLMQEGESIADDIEAGRSCSGDRAARLAAASFGEFVERGEAEAAMRRWSKPDRKRAGAVRRALAEGAEGVLARLWPKLTTVNCWLGGHAPFYIRQLEPYLAKGAGRLPLRDPGFSASEGFFGVPMGAETAEGVLHVRGAFMEFVPEGETPERTLLAHELEVGGRYELIVSTGGGLWRYAMRDVVEVTGHYRATPLVRFLHKAGNILSITGEKVTESHAVAAATRLSERFAIENACAAIALTDPPRYVVAVEPATDAPLDAGAMAEFWDGAMAAVNVEYAEKRASGRLGPAEVRLTAPGAFVRWREQRVRAGAPDGQVKLPPLSRTLDTLEVELLTPEVDP